MRLGFVVGTADQSDLALLTRLGQAALAAGHQVRIFLMHEGIHLAHRPELAALADAGAEATVCGTNATRVGLDLRGAAAVEGSQLDHAALARECDRLVSLATRAERPQADRDHGPGSTIPVRGASRASVGPPGGAATDELHGERPARRVAGVVVRSASERSGSAGEALRGAVGLAAGGLTVRVFLVEDGAGALALGGEAHKALHTLHTLGHQVLVEREALAARSLAAPAFVRVAARDTLPGLLAACDVVETWR